MIELKLIDEHRIPDHVMAASLLKTKRLNIAYSKADEDNSESESNWTKKAIEAFDLNIKGLTKLQALERLRNLISANFKNSIYRTLFMLLCNMDSYENPVEELGKFLRLKSKETNA